MQEKPFLGTVPPAADESEPESVHQQDPAGGIVLSGRNRLCNRVRTLAGMAMTSGLVVALGALDTTSSAPHPH
jgi:hypothetical protein